MREIAANSTMRNALLIAKREYVERIRSRAFRISTVLMPLLFGVIFGVGSFSANHIASGAHIVIVSDDAALAGHVRDELLLQPTSFSSSA